MSLVDPDPALSISPSDRMALEFDAPYITDKLVKDRIADSIADATALFDEAKKFILLSQNCGGAVCEMYSVRVDEAWHQFILCTTEYSTYCQRFFGKYVHHSPTIAPSSRREATGSKNSMSFIEFRERYEAFFREPLPDVWYDSRSVSPHRRVANDEAGRWRVVHNGGEVEMINASGATMISVNNIAGPALEFIAGIGTFYVRELPGNLSHEEKTALIKALVAGGFLRVIA
jgi:hypothetical protein